MSMLSIHATINTCIPWPASESPEEPPAAAICVAGSPTMQQQLPSTRLRFSDEPEPPWPPAEAAGLTPRKEQAAGALPQTSTPATAASPPFLTARARPAAAAARGGSESGGKRRGGKVASAGRPQYHAKAQMQGPKVVHY